MLLSDIEAVADFARSMQQQDLLTSGDYIIISIEDEEVYTPTKQYQYFGHVFEAKEDDPHKSFPFQAVLIVTPSGPVNPDYDHFKKQVNCRNSRHPFSIPSHHMVKPDVSSNQLLFSLMALLKKASK